MDIYYDRSELKIAIKVICEDKVFDNFLKDPEMAAATVICPVPPAANAFALRRFGNIWYLNFQSNFFYRAQLLASKQTSSEPTVTFTGSLRQKIKEEIDRW